MRKLILNHQAIQRTFYVIKLLILEDYKIYVSRVLGVIVLNYKLPVEARLAIFIDFKECLKFLLVIKLTEDVP